MFWLCFDFVLALFRLQFLFEGYIRGGQNWPTSTLNAIFSCTSIVALHSSPVSVYESVVRIKLAYLWGLRACFTWMTLLVDFLSSARCWWSRYQSFTMAMQSLLTQQSPPSPSAFSTLSGNCLHSSIQVFYPLYFVFQTFPLKIGTSMTALLYKISLQKWEIMCKPTDTKKKFQLPRHVGSVAMDHRSPCLAYRHTQDCLPKGLSSYSSKS